MAGSRTPATQRKESSRPSQSGDEFQQAMAELHVAAMAMNKLTSTLEPLAEHVPALISMAHAWKTGEAVSRTAKLAGAAVKWIGGVAIGLAAIWAVAHMKWLALLGAQS